MEIFDRAGFRLGKLNLNPEALILSDETLLPFKRMVAISPKAVFNTNAGAPMGRKGRLKALANFLENDCDEPSFMPALGEHSSEILKEYGFSDDEINNLIESQIVQGEKIA